LQGPEADQLLESRGVPVGVRQAVLAFAGGHPLTLAGAADIARRCDTVPSPDHRMALLVCAHADATSAQLLRVVVPGNHTPHAES
jgi:hypothetical protein